MNTVSNAEIRPLEASEIDDVSGGLWGILAAVGGLFAVGVGIGIVAFNVTHDRPWYEI